MLILRNSSLALFFFSMLSCAGENTVIDNSLAECVKLTAKEVNIDSQIPYIKIAFKQKKLTSECGCKSALNSYKSYVIIKGSKSYIQGGIFTFMGEREEIILPIASQAKILSDNSVKISVSCALPE